jgi:hypothetical protein
VGTPGCTRTGTPPTPSGRQKGVYPYGHTPSLICQTYSRAGSPSGRRRPVPGWRNQPSGSPIVLNKDQVRAALFPPPVLDYSAAQDDLCMAAIYSAAAHIRNASPQQVVIRDGRDSKTPEGVAEGLRAGLAYWRGLWS